MRRRLVLLVLATTSLVVVAFLIPLALLVRSSAADRAVSAAAVDIQALAPLVATGDVAALETAVKAEARKITVFLPDGRVVGTPAARSPAVDRAATGRSMAAETADGREVLVAVAGLPGGARARLGGRTITAGIDMAVLEDGTVAGSRVTMDRAFQVLVGRIGLSLVDAVMLCATTPARELGLVGCGMLTPDAVADLVVLDATEPEMAVAELAPVLYAFKRGRRTVTREPARLNRPG